MVRTQGLVKILTAFCGSIAFVLLCQPTNADEYLTGMEWKEPPIIQPGDPHQPPSDAVVLFNGNDLSEWKNVDNWKVVDGAMVSGKGDAVSKQAFGDCQLHIEWSAKTPATGSGQGRSNSGVFLMNNYELQVLDSYDNKTYFDGQAGAIYKQTPPMVNAMRPPGEWNVYDVVWTAPRFNDDGSLKSPAYITALHNGVVILNHFELLGDTPFNRAPEYNKHDDRLPIRLQDHGNPVRFRNIWVRDLNPPIGQRAKEPFLRDGDGNERPLAVQ
ncbi:MAG: DUF1080 domain-containing protein [Planctomycetales bacterium]|nr:DUF1080 domain-containing protein [Planctomycetales bacterium]